MKLAHHTLISVMLSPLVYLFSRSLTAARACFGAGILIDIYHFFEFFYKFGFRRISLKRFFRAAENHEYDRFFLLFHSYELALILWLIAIFLIRKPWAWGFALGFTVHIIADQIYNPCHPLTYLLLYRIKNRFVGDRLFPPKIQERYKEKRKGWGNKNPNAGPP